MKKSILIITIALFMGCSSTQLEESWKNPDIDTYEPYKVLIVGLTSDEVARQQFEVKLKKELELRGSEAIVSFDILNHTSKTDKMSEAELNALESQLIEDGFDTILLTKIVGVEEKTTYRETDNGYDETTRKFKDEYLMHQDVFYNPDYYNNYTVYKAETSMYCICPTKDRELIWKGYINITDPQSQSIEKTVNDYVRLAIIVLEEEHLINPLVIHNVETTEKIVQ
ncbi:hypothetical protein [Psychroserpens ponticola]|uniref:Cardiolipin synthetase n=1 Tax=Psychroserpens ponticola TaxID=2932268 RepID=A0ABY7S0E1_9FLAO|nr:hypothetical protein [Psychroserpens ponticola]WCO02849.1 hypothetical protein MUN68_005000 [Psychroserpens ponticola]